MSFCHLNPNLKWKGVGANSGKGSFPFPTGKGMLLFGRRHSDINLGFFLEFLSSDFYKEESNQHQTFGNLTLAQRRNFNSFSIEEEGKSKRD